MSEIEKALKDASAPNFWGEVSITYREGRAFIVKVTRTTHAFVNLTWPHFDHLIWPHLG